MKLLIGAIEFFKTFGCMLFRVDSIVNDLDNSGPLDFFLIILVSDRLVIMWEGEILKIGIILFELFVDISVVDGLDLDSLPIFILFIGSIFLKGDDLFCDLFCNRITMNKFIVNYGIVISPVDGSVLAAEHIHFRVYFFVF